MIDELVYLVHGITGFNREELATIRGQESSHKTHDKNLNNRHRSHLQQRPESHFFFVILYSKGLLWLKLGSCFSLGLSSSALAASSSAVYLQRINKPEKRENIRGKQRFTLSIYIFIYKLTEAE